MIWYAIASLTPAILLALACLRGGAWPLLAVLSITGLAAGLDRIAKASPERDTSGRLISLTLGGVHFALLPLGIWAISEATGLTLSDKILIFIGLGLFFGQISNSNAHELIHATTRWPRRFGTAIYCSLLNGHHVSAHLRVHHIHAATDADPNSARLGEGFYTYALRVLRAGIYRRPEGRDKTARQKRAQKRAVAPLCRLCRWRPSVACRCLPDRWGAGYACSAGAVHLCAIAADPVRLCAALWLAPSPRADGRPEPVGPRHSWNAPEWYSSAMMLNAPRHSDHHMQPTRPFPALAIAPAGCPFLPRSLPVMATIALAPPLWRRIMDPRVARWQNPA